MLNFSLIGAAGYIAPRHMKAIKETNNDLVACYDINDSVGIIDSYFPEARFFTEFERFDRHIEKLKYENDLFIDYTSICSPNYLHDAHIRFALRSGSNAICEKPLVLNPWNIDKLSKAEDNTGKKIYTVLQLREHESIIELKNRYKKFDRKLKINLTYITSRGNWYYNSWKGDNSKSGGIASNIGVHFFDMLTWIFGKVDQNFVHVNNEKTSAGFLSLENAEVSWFLSIDSNTLPKFISEKGQRTFRSINIDNEELEFSEGFTELHTKAYNSILNEKGYGIYDTYEAIDLVHKIRNSKLSKKGIFHPFLEK